MFSLAKRLNWKRSRNLADLLNDNDIINSREKSEPASSTSGNSSAETNTLPPQDTYDDHRKPLHFPLLKLFNLGLKAL